MTMVQGNLKPGASSLGRSSLRGLILSHVPLSQISQHSTSCAGMWVSPNCWHFFFCFLSPREDLWHSDPRFSITIRDLTPHWWYWVPQSLLPLELKPFMGRSSSPQGLTNHSQVLSFSYKLHTNLACCNTDLLSEFTTDEAACCRWSTHVKDCEIFRATMTQTELNECINLPNILLNKKVDSSDGRGMKNNCKTYHSKRKFAALLISATIKVRVGCPHYETWKIVMIFLLISVRTKACL